MVDWWWVAAAYVAGQLSLLIIMAFLSVASDSDADRKFHSETKGRT